MTSSSAAGTVVALWRFPVKSMQEEELNASHVGERGLLGDRGYALIDSTDGKVASAKNPRKWPNLFAFRAAYVESPGPGKPLPGIRITLPDGVVLAGKTPATDEALAQAVGRPVSLCGVPPPTPALEEYWPDMNGLSHRDTVTDEAMPQGTFFDLGTVHLLTTATLDRLRDLYPKGRFEVRRFRPNLVIEPPGGTRGFVEGAWIGRIIRMGEDVRLQITKPCGRCVMTTLPQSDLPKDPGILRTAVQHNAGQVGVYAKVLEGGIVRRGDQVFVEED
jgi:uncharacterized protein YcbX